MKVKIKSIFALILAIIVVITSLNFSSIDSHAISGIAFDLSRDNKTIDIYMKPYGKMKKRYVMYSSFSYSGAMSLNSKLYYPSGNEVGEEDILESGVTYNYEATFTALKSDTKPAMDISDYTVGIIDYWDKNDKSFYSNETVEVISSTEIVFKCNITIKTEKQFDLGSICVDLSENPFYPEDHSVDYNDIFVLLDALKEDSQIVHLTYDSYDLNKDNLSDISIYVWDKTTNMYRSGLMKHESCSIEGVYTLKLSDEINKQYCDEGWPHYSEITLIFDRIDLSGCEISGIKDEKWTGAAITQNPVVIYNGKTLTKDVDYTVSYKDNINVGKASVTVTGINLYKGELTKNFEIFDDQKNNSGNSSSNGNGSGANNSNDASGAGGAAGNQGAAVSYENEWVNGQWYGANGDTSYTALGSWKSDSNGWWFEDTSGWYPQSQWQKIDGKWYYFTETGYMDYSEYRDGCWLGSDGAWVEEYFGGHWCSDNTGWWYEDSSGWYPYDQYLWIDGVNYYFGADGYLQ